jgi:hypothetical protein
MMPARATFCFCPSDSSWMLDSSRSCSPNWSAASVIRCRIRLGGVLRHSWAKASSSVNIQGEKLLLRVLKQSAQIMAYGMDRTISIINACHHNLSGPGYPESKWGAESVCQSDEC